MKQKALVWGLLISASTGMAADRFPAEVDIVRLPPAHGSNAFYAGNRTPLLPDRLIKLPLGAVKPHGWLRDQLRLLADGMVGHLPQHSHWCQRENSAWLSPDGTGDHGWEELPYWLRGYISLGYVLEDTRIIEEARLWIDGVLAAQWPDGYFGAKTNRDANDLWPNMVMLNALESYHEATGDPRVVEFMTRYFRWQHAQPADSLLPGSWQKWRAGDNLRSIYWLYNRTGEPWLLDLATTIHQRTADWTHSIPTWHGVNLCQCFRQPATYYQQSKRKKHLRATERIYDTVMKRYGQVPGGMFGADENCREGYTGPQQAAETCSMVEFMHSFSVLLGITGDLVYAARCEDVAFNSLPAAMTADCKALHYLTAPNMVQLDRGNKSPGLQNAGCMLAYSPGPIYRCCQHNVAKGWPYFTEYAWMATRDNGLATALYAPCEVTARVGRGAIVRIMEETAYPFSEMVELRVALDAPEQFPLLLRVPDWCDNATLHLNGTPLHKRLRAGRYVRLDREWCDGDTVSLALPMEIRLRRWTENQNAVSVDRGPLTYSLKINERWERYNDSREWPEWEVYPASPWNYALVVNSRNPSASFEVHHHAGPPPAHPFSPGTPVYLKAKGRRIPGWQMVGGLIGPLQESPVRTSAPEEEITLIPMGAARLRVSAFPVYGEGRHAHEWTVPPPAPLEFSHVNDNPMAIVDGIVPTRPEDFAGVPRMTWWDHKGTNEWVIRRFDEPRTVKRTRVYWYDDTGHGGCRVPAMWRVLWYDNTAWREVSNASGYGVKAGTFNSVTFDPVTTSALRLEVQLQPEYSGGILEWCVE